LAGHHAIAHAVPIPAPAPVRSVVETEEVAIDPSYQFGYSVSDTKTGKNLFEFSRQNQNCHTLNIRAKITYFHLLSKLKVSIFPQLQ